MHHVNLFPFCTGRLPTLKQGRPLTLKRRDAAARSSTEQGYKDLTPGPRVESEQRSKLGFLRIGLTRANRE